MKTIDGGAKLGSGTIVRYSVALASLPGKDTKIENIRQQRQISKPRSLSPARYVLDGYYTTAFILIASRF